MIERLRRTTLFVAYQAALALSLFMLPVALAMEHVALSAPFHRPADSMKDRLDRDD